jgi:hypothetical protein
VQCYYRGPFRNIQFEKTSYQQFLRKQGLTEHAIRYLNIHFITDFTLSDFEGCIDLAERGAFFKHGREYVEQENETTIGFYRPVDSPRKYAAIFLRPARCYTLACLNETFLHETRHHIQHCLKSECCSAVVPGVANEAHSAPTQPWEIDAHLFAKAYGSQVSFLSSILQRSNLPPPMKRSD